MRPATLEEVVRGGLCTGCGICASLAGAKHITMALSPRGDSRPVFHTPLAAAAQARLVDVCPGVTMRGPGAEPAEPGTTVDPIWGPLRRLARAWATEPEVRHAAAAGGTLSALAAFLLDSGRVDAVLHVRACVDAPLLTEATVSRTAAAALAGARSRYGPAAPLTHVRELLDAGERFAVIAKPCDISAIRNLARHDSRVVAQVPYLLTIFCGGAPNLGTAVRIARYHGLAPDAVAEFRWRGYGWPGATHVEAVDGATFDLSYRETWFDRSRPWRYDAQWRCKICVDPIGELADVAAPDGWLLDAAGRPLHDEAPGVNAILERTAAGTELVAAATTAGYLAQAPLTRADFEAMHRDHHQRRLGAPARLAALRLGRAGRPRVHGYRLGHAARRAGPALLRRQLLGALRRIRAGQAREAVLREPEPPVDRRSP